MYEVSSTFFLLLRAGRTVTRLQTVRGTDFMYHPPPRQKMPGAATIAGAPINRCVMLVCSQAVSVTRLPQNRWWSIRRILRPAQQPWTV